MSQTAINYTGQRLDGTGLLYYHARYYDPSLGKFLTPDSIVPGASTGAGGALGTVGQEQNSKLTVDFHEAGFVSSVNGENQQILSKGFWFQLSGRDKQRAKEPWGPDNPQALNRYSYVLDNPLRYVDPTGHLVRIGHQKARELIGMVTNLISQLELVQTIQNGLDVAALGGAAIIIGVVLAVGALGASILAVLGAVGAQREMDLGDPSGVKDALKFYRWLLDQLESFDSTPDSLYLDLWLGIDFKGRPYAMTRMEGSGATSRCDVNTEIYANLIGTVGDRRYPAARGTYPYAE